MTVQHSRLSTRIGSNCSRVLAALIGLYLLFVVTFDYVVEEPVVVKLRPINSSPYESSLGIKQGVQKGFFREMWDTLVKPKNIDKEEFQLPRRSGGKGFIAPGVYGGLLTDIMDAEREKQKPKGKWATLEDEKKENAALDAAAVASAVAEIDKNAKNSAGEVVAEPEWLDTGADNAAEIAVQQTKSKKRRKNKKGEEKFGLDFFQTAGEEDSESSEESGSQGSDFFTRPSCKAQIANTHPIHKVKQPLTRVKNGDQWHFLYYHFFKNVHHGVFVEAGSADPLAANTYFLERHLCWAGLCVEPVSRFHALSQATRPNCELVKGALSSKSGFDRFLTVENDPFLSGLVSSMDKDKLDEIHDSKLHYSLSKVSMHLVGKLLLQRNLSHVDLLVLDCEGCEQAVVTTFPFSKVHVDVWMLETVTEKIVTRLADNDYWLVACASFDVLFMHMSSKLRENVFDSLPPLTSSCSANKLDEYMALLGDHPNNGWAQEVKRLRRTGRAEKVEDEIFERSPAVCATALSVFFVVVSVV